MEASPPRRNAVLSAHGVFRVLLGLFLCAQLGLIPPPRPRRNTVRTPFDEVIRAFHEELADRAELSPAGPVWLGLSAADRRIPAGPAEERKFLEILKVFRTVRDELAGCYERGLRWRPELTGVLQVYFSVGPSGGVTFATVERDTLDDPIVRHCVLRRMADWRFDATGCEAEFSIPFVFMPPR